MLARAARRALASTPELGVERLTGDFAGVTALTLRRPPANALGSALLNALADAVGEIRFDGETRVVLLRAAPPAVEGKRAVCCYWHRVF